MSAPELPRFGREPTYRTCSGCKERVMIGRGGSIKEHPARLPDGHLSRTENCPGSRKRPLPAPASLATGLGRASLDHAEENERVKESERAKREAPAPAPGLGCPFEKLNRDGAILWRCGRERGHESTPARAAHVEERSVLAWAGTDDNGDEGYIVACPEHAPGLARSTGLALTGASDFPRHGGGEYEEACDSCEGDTDPDPLDAGDRDPGPVESEDLDKWAERYDSLNGAPEGDGDR